jgi:tRNA splicing ligase
VQALVHSSIVVALLEARPEPLLRAEVHSSIAAVLAAAHIPAELHIHRGTENNSTVADNSTKAADSSTDKDGNNREEDTTDQLQFRFQWEGRCQF